MQQQKAPQTLDQLAQQLERHNRRVSFFQWLTVFLLVSLFVICIFFSTNAAPQLSLVLLKIGFVLLNLLLGSLVIVSLMDGNNLLERIRVQLDTTTRTELLGLLRLLRLLDGSRFSAGKQERRLRRSALSLLGHFLALIPQDELGTLSQKDRDYLVRELRWRLRRSRRTKPHDVELSIRLFLALTELRHRGAEELADRALRHREPRLRLSAQTYLDHSKAI